MASVRFICGTSDLHLALERRIASYVQTEDAILFAACFDANGGVFEPLFGEQDAIVSDTLNHASIIDGVRLSRAARYRYSNGDMADLEAQLRLARDQAKRRIVIVTDGVFSMDGYFAKLGEIRKLADTYDALILVDDCHATGFTGPQGRERQPAPDQGRYSDRNLGQFGWLRRRLHRSSKTHRRSHAPAFAPLSVFQCLAVAIVAAAIKAIDLAEQGDDLRAKLFDNAALPRRHEQRGFQSTGRRTPHYPRHVR
jgi:glycine C-acetyltransferase